MPSGARPSPAGATRRALSPPVFALLSVSLGVVAGLGAYLFRLFIAVVHNLAFLGRFSTVYDTNQHTPLSGWGVAVVLVPVAGSVLVVYLVRHFAPEARGHGVPEVIDAIYYQKSLIRPVVGVVKSVASAVSIGTGGSVGREGPIVQISAAAASLGGRLFRASQWQRATLVAAGGGAGIAATFNTPIGGALFAVEVLLHEVSVRTLVPVALATATATFVGRLFFGNVPAFPVPALLTAGAGRIAVLPASILLGCLMALMSVVFIRGLYAVEDQLQRLIPDHDYVRHAVGMLVVGVLFAGLGAWRGHYYIQGVGYATVIEVLSGALTSVGFLILLTLLKLTATCLTLGSGGSGGIFSPSLFMGATLGGVYGVALAAAFPGFTTEPNVFALVGMAALLSGTTGAALTSVVMMFEMTLDYNLILPLTLAAAVSYGLRRVYLADSIYTAKLTRRGHAVPEALQANVHLLRHVSDIAITSVSVLPADASPEKLSANGDQGPSHFAIVHEGAIVGFVSRDWVLGHPSEVRAAGNLGAIARRDVVVVPAETTLVDLVAMMKKAGASAAIVASPAETAANGQRPAAQIHGMITSDHLATALSEGIELFTD